MPVAILESEVDFDGWRRSARAFRLAGVAPEAASWRVGGDLFEQALPQPASDAAPFSAPLAFIETAKGVVCHRDADRFNLLYRMLWRLAEAPQLMHLVTDTDVLAATHMAKEVSKSSHKMKAFLRFRRMEDETGETFIAWFQPAHRVVERTSGFFVKRFANMRFSILTPDACAHWDGDKLALTPGADRGDAPADDQLEEFWRTYYGSIFNPARLKVKAMEKEMPRFYWRNLPEASLIPGLIDQAEQRSAAMIQAEPTECKRRVTRAQAAPQPPEDGPMVAKLTDIKPAIQLCRRCDLWRDATQGVAGEGPGHARLMLVGEQPGDQEDLAGKPFVGPAGQVLDKALAEAGVPRGEVFVTNAVKHFKHEPRGKRRLHRTPDGGEVAACRFWLEQERRLVRPRMILALGATAALSVIGKPMPIGKSRGQVFQLEDQAKAMITGHPSAILRIPDRDAKAAAYRRLVEDLAAAWKEVA